MDESELNSINCIYRFSTTTQYQRGVKMFKHNGIAGAAGMMQATKRKAAEVPAGQQPGGLSPAAPTK